jgi:hypothetical protein
MPGGKMIRARLPTEPATTTRHAGNITDKLNPSSMPSVIASFSPGIIAGHALPLSPGHTGITPLCAGPNIILLDAIRRCTRSRLAGSV